MYPIMVSTEAVWLFGPEIAGLLSDEAPRELRVSPAAVQHAAVFILEQQAILTPRPSAKLLVTNRLDKAMKRQERFNNDHHIEASFEQTGRLLVKAAMCAALGFEEISPLEPLQLPDEFKDFHPQHLERLAPYFGIEG